MICYRCGAQVPDDSDFCAQCGAIAANKEPQLAFSTEASQEQTADHAKPDYDGFPMNWYKLLIHFLLYAGFILNLVSGILQIFGMQYGEYTPLYYAEFPTLKTVDIVFGILTILFAFYVLYVRFELAKLKKHAPLKLMIAYLLNMLISAAYLVITAFLFASTDAGVDRLDLYAKLISLVLGSGIILYCNLVYFKKRKSLFVN